MSAFAVLITLHKLSNDKCCIPKFPKVEETSLKYAEMQYGFNVLVQGMSTFTFDITAYKLFKDQMAFS